MRNTTRIGVGALVLGGLWAATAWPRLNDVATGQTPEYPDLKAREYAATPEKVAQAAKDALEHRPGWKLVGAGQGPGGHSLQAVHATPVLGFEDEVTVQVRRVGGKTRVSVRSRSRWLAWDFGQNARNVRELLAALDAKVS